jgi:hypothetical protein
MVLVKEISLYTCPATDKTILNVLNFKVDRNCLKKYGTLPIHSTCPESEIRDPGWVKITMLFGPVL